MRLVVTIPESSRRQVTGSRMLAELGSGIEIEVAPIAPMPEDVAAWARSVPLRDLSGGVARVEITASHEAKSDLEWPLVVHESIGLDAAGNHVQRRIHVLFILVEHCAMIALRGTDDAAFTARRDELLAIARTGRPEWGVPPGASLEDLLAT